jgi:membrane associated rhomboid family serine protease
MTPTPVGMRCPECARQRTRVRTARTMTSVPRVTYALIAINVVAFIAEVVAGGGLASRGSGTVVDHGALSRIGIADHDYWRLVTAGFLHAGFLHIGLNMYLLYILGQMIEPALGPVRFAALYFAALLAGSFGALVATTNPLTETVGASGAIFGLMGAAVVMMRARGISVMESGVGGLLVLNLVFSFVISGISIGGHIGGLIGGIVAAAALEFGMQRRSELIGLAGCLVVAVISVYGGIAVAS